MIQITSETRTDDRMSFELSTERKSAFIGFSRSLGFVNVCCLNASHRAWRGLGKTFTSWTEARAAYKSADMLAMLEYAQSQCE